MKKRKIAFDVLLFLSFLIPTVIMLVIFMINKIYPFGKNSFLYMDLYHQYMPFFTEFMDKISAGESLNYSFRVGVGSNFLALYVYYLASPIHYLAFLFPKEHLVEFISYLVIVKIGLTGLTGCYYLKKHFQTESPICVGLSIMYALSGFMAAYNWNIMWLDCVILLPLIMLGLEQLVKEGKWKLYCLALACSIYTNFYISIMICMFLILYFLCLLVTEKFSLSAIVKFGVFSLLAGGLASVLLIPEVCAIMATDFGDISFPKELKTYFSVLDELARHCVGVSVERGLKHWPNIYCGSFVFLLVPLYAICPKISARKRFVNLALIGFFLLGFSTNVLEFIWHGLNYPDSLPARQSFIYVLIVLTICGEVLLHSKEMEPGKILYSFLGTVGFLLFCQKLVTDDHFKTGVFLMTLLFAAFYSIMLYLYRTRSGENWKTAMIGCAIAVVIIEAGVNTYQTSVPYIVRDNYLNPLKDYQALTLQAQEREEKLGNSPIFRFDKFVRKTKNDGTLAGYPSASLFSSTLNSQVMDLYHKLGLQYSKVFYCHDGATAFVSALLNVRYMYDQQSDKESTEENDLFTKLGKSGNVTLYAAEKVLPFGYVAPYGFDLPEGVENSPFTIQNQLVNALGIDEDLFLKSRCSQVGDNVELVPARSGYYYMMVSGSGTKKVKAEGDIERKYDNLKRYETMYVGYLKAGEKVVFSNDDKEDTTPSINLSAYRMDTEVLDRALEELSRQYMTEVTYEDSHLTGKLSLKESGRLILTIPYEKGWTIRVNGEITEPQLFGEAFIALDLQSGEYTIDMEYVPYGKPQGLAITLVSLLVLAGIWIVEYLYGKKQASIAVTAREQA